jgi:hypothetical protein
MKEYLSRRLTNILFILIGATFIIMLSGLYLWYVVPEELIIELKDGKKEKVSTDTFMGTILDVAQ